MTPKILITNDDSIYSQGIKTLVQVAREFGDVTVVAPLSMQSAMSNALTVRRKIDLHHIEKKENVEWYGITGTTADCVKIAFNFILKTKPDLVLSGINHGTNASINSFYSGTVAGATEGILKGVNAVSFSLLDNAYEAEFDHCFDEVRTIIKRSLTFPKNKMCLNVNIPQKSTSKIQGIKICSHAHGWWGEKYEEIETASKGRSFMLRGEDFFHDNKENTDIPLLEKNYITVVPLVSNLTNYQQVEELKSLFDAQQSC